MHFAVEKRRAVGWSRGTGRTKKARKAKAWTRNKHDSTDFVSYGYAWYDVGARERGDVRYAVSSDAFCVTPPLCSCVAISSPS